MNNIIDELLEPELRILVEHDLWDMGLRQPIILRVVAAYTITVFKPVIVVSGIEATCEKDQFILNLYCFTKLCKRFNIMHTFNSTNPVMPFQFDEWDHPTAPYRYWAERINAQAKAGLFRLIPTEMIND